MTDETRLLISKTDDLTASVKRGRSIAFTSFLSEEEQSVVLLHTKGSGLVVSAYGGYDGAQRRIISFSDSIPGSDLYPLTTMFFTFKGCEITHRDVLGSLMSLGIKRCMIGDIVLDNNCCYFFADSKLSVFLIDNLFSVRNIGIKLSEYDGFIQYTQKFEDITGIVSSLRLDCVVGELASLSRTSATELIESGYVYINGVQCIKKDKSVAENDILSIRHAGKYRINAIIGKTKKDRLRISISKYI